MSTIQEKQKLGRKDALERSIFTLKNRTWLTYFLNAFPISSLLVLQEGFLLKIV
jgi:hypothetical protein